MFDSPLEALEAIPAEFLEQPPFAACYGIILAATRAPKQALHYLQIARNARLFPEEEKLVSEALLAIDDSASGRGRSIETALDSQR